MPKMVVSSSLDEHASFMIFFHICRFLSGGSDEIKMKTRSWHTILAEHFKTEDDLDRKAEVCGFLYNFEVVL